MTTSADLAHVRDVAAVDRPAAARWAWIAARQRTWLAALLIVIFSALVLPPFVLLVQGSLTVGSTGVSDGQWGFGNFEAVLRSRHFVVEAPNRRGILRDILSILIDGHNIDMTALDSQVIADEGGRPLARFEIGITDERVDFARLENDLNAIGVRIASVGG